MDLSEMVSIHTKNWLPVQDYANAQQTFAGAEDSVDGDGPPVERVLPFSDHPKRNTEDWDRDPSWLAEQSNEMAPDIMHNVHGRKISRSDNNAMHIDAHGPPTNYHDP
jgi:hypothetical protein